MQLEDPGRYEMLLEDPRRRHELEEAWYPPTQLHEIISLLSTPTAASLTAITKTPAFGFRETLVFLCYYSSPRNLDKQERVGRSSVNVNMHGCIGVCSCEVKRYPSKQSEACPRLTLVIGRCEGYRDMRVLLFNSLMARSRSFHSPAISHTYTPRRGPNWVEHTGFKHVRGLSLVTFTQPCGSCCVLLGKYKINNTAIIIS